MLKNTIIALGSNLDSPAQQIRQAANLIAQQPEIHDWQLSPLYRSAPVGYTAQPDFVNAVAVAKTSLSAPDLLILLQKIENEFGRVRSFQNAPRTLDLDMIDFNQEIWGTDTLVLPHPRAHLRHFVMLPLAQIAPDYPIGQYGSAAQLAAQLGEEGIELLHE